MACYGYGMHFLKQRLSQAALHGEVILIGDSPRYPFICLLAVYRLVTNYINLLCCKVYKWPKNAHGTKQNHLSWRRNLILRSLTPHSIYLLYIYNPTDPNTS